MRVVNSLFADPPHRSCLLDGESFGAISLSCGPCSRFFGGRRWEQVACNPPSSRPHCHRCQRACEHTAYHRPTSKPVLGTSPAGTTVLGRRLVDAGQACRRAFEGCKDGVYIRPDDRAGTGAPCPPPAPRPRSRPAQTRAPWAD